ncbi:MAG: hypothetical protein J5985_07475 [Kiritimatiellae bacterium]|nr:hypothetical protein [Kiritimatiellia bacterium]
MKHKTEIAADLVCLFAAALLQDLLPVTPAWPVKFPFLTGVAVWMVVRHAAEEALVCALWAGLLTDALGDLPLMCTSCFLFCLYGIAWFLLRFDPAPAFWRVVLFCGAAAPLQVLWIQFWIGGKQLLTFVQILARCALAFPAGLVAGTVGMALVAGLDHLSGRRQASEARHGIFQAEING